MDDEDLIELNIRYDIPNDAAERLEELSSVTSDLRTNLELNSRFTQEQVNYYKELVEISRSVIAFQTELNDVIEARVGAESRLRDIRGDDLEYLNQVEERAQTVGGQLSGLVGGEGAGPVAGGEDGQLLDSIRDIVGGQRGGRAGSAAGGGLLAGAAGLGATVFGQAMSGEGEGQRREGQQEQQGETERVVERVVERQAESGERFPELPPLDDREPSPAPQQQTRTGESVSEPAQQVSAERPAPAPEMETKELPAAEPSTQTARDGGGQEPPQGTPRATGEAPQPEEPSTVGDSLEGGEEPQQRSQVQETLNRLGLGGLIPEDGMISNQLTNLFQGMGGSTGGGIVGAIGRTIPWIGAAVAGMSAMGAVGQTYQGYRNLGGITGGGFQEGLGYQAEIRTMAMNPFISTDQAREVVMSALNQGYTGREFETVTEFMAENMREMNMSTAESMELLRTNVEQGGQSIEALGVQLGTVTSLADGSNMSAAAMQEIFRQTSGAAIELGTSGQAAGELGVLGSTMFQDEVDEDGNVIPNPLKGRGGDILTGMLSSQAFQANVRNTRGIDANIYEIPDIISEDGTAAQEIERVLREQAEQSPDAYRFAERLQRLYGVSVSLPEARALMDQVTSEEGIIEPALENVEEAAETESRGFLNKISGGFTTNTVNELANVGGGIARVGGTGWAGLQTIWYGLGALAGDEGSAAKLDEIWDIQGEKWDQYGRTMDARDLGVRAGVRNEAIENLAKQYGMSDLELIEGGERISFDDLNWDDRRTFDRVTEGQISVRGQDPMTLGELTMSGGLAGDGGVFTGEGSFTTPQGLTIGLTPEASRVLQIEGSPTQNELQSFYGSNGASLNDPAIGDPRAGR